MKVSEIKKTLSDLPDDIDLDIDSHNVLDVFIIKTPSKEYSVQMELSLSRYNLDKKCFIIRYSTDSQNEKTVKTIRIASYKTLLIKYNKYKQKILDSLSPQEKMELL